MSSVRKTIVVTEQQNNWIAQQLTAGYFTNDSELIRDLIRKEQMRQQEMDVIRAALIVGEQSGEAKSIDFQQFIARKQTQHIG